MYFIDQRIQVICNQLQMFRFRNTTALTEWQFKKGQFVRPEQADAAEGQWEIFDAPSMGSHRVGHD